MWGLTCVSYPTVFEDWCVCYYSYQYWCVSCPVLSIFLLFVLLSGRRPALLASLYFVPSRKRHLARYVCRFALCICTLNRSLNLLVLYFIKSWKTSAVSATVWMVETLLCKLRGRYIRHVRIVWFLWTKRTIWLVILSFTLNIVRACSMFYPYEGYRSVTPLDAARVNRTIFHKHSVHWYYIILIRVGIILSTILI